MRLMTLVLTGALVACGGEADSPKPEPTLNALPAVVTKALELQHAVAASSGNADVVLASKGISPAELTTMLAEIAADPELTAAYEQGRK